VLAAKTSREVRDMSVRKSEILIVGIALLSFAIGIYSATHQYSIGDYIFTVV